MGIKIYLACILCVREEQQQGVLAWKLFWFWPQAMLCTMQVGLPNLLCMINFQTILAKISHKSFLEKRRFIYARHHENWEGFCAVSIDQKRPQHSIHKDIYWGHLIIPMFKTLALLIRYLFSQWRVNGNAWKSHMDEKWADHYYMSHDKLQKRGVETYCQISFDLSWMNKSAS